MKNFKIEIEHLTKDELIDKMEELGSEATSYGFFQEVSSCDKEILEYEKGITLNHKKIEVCEKAIMLILEKEDI